MADFQPKQIGTYMPSFTIPALRWFNPVADARPERAGTAG